MTQSADRARPDTPPPCTGIARARRRRPTGGAVELIRAASDCPPRHLGLAVLVLVVLPLYACQISPESRTTPGRDSARTRTASPTDGTPVGRNEPLAATVPTSKKSTQTDTRSSLEPPPAPNLPASEDVKPVGKATIVSKTTAAPDSPTADTPSVKQQPAPGADGSEIGSATPATTPPATPAVVTTAPPKLRGRRTLPGQNRFYDRDNPTYGMLQKANQAMARFPVDREGQIDWVNALQTGQIKPRSGVRGGTRMQTLDGDIIMRNTREMPHVLFSHRAHTEWLACSNCHEKPFPTRAGVTSMTMTDIFRGKYCGMCHDKVAFSTFVCERCHSVAVQ